MFMFTVRKSVFWSRTAFELALRLTITQLSFSWTFVESAPSLKTALFFCYKQASYELNTILKPKEKYQTENWKTSHLAFWIEGKRSIKIITFKIFKTFPDKQNVLNFWSRISLRFVIYVQNTMNYKFLFFICEYLAWLWNL